MGFPHCPICVVLAFLSVFIGITRSYMFSILLKEFISKESNLKLNINLANGLTTKYKYFKYKL